MDLSMSKKKFPFFLWIGITAISIGILIYFLFLKMHKNEIKAETLYRFRLENALHETFTLNNFKGKFIVVNCWQTWCGPCLQEMPMLDSVFQKRDKDKWVFVVITDEDWEKINTVQANGNFQMPLYRSKSSFVANNIAAYPVTIILNDKGEVISQKLGMLPYNAAEFLNYLNQLQK